MKLFLLVLNLNKSLLLILIISNNAPTMFCSLGNGRLLAVGQGSVSGEKTHLNWTLSPPEAYLLEIQAPQVLRNTSTGCHWGPLQGSTQEPPADRWAYKLNGHTEE